MSERRDQVDVIKSAVEKANNEIVDLSKKVDNLLVDGLITNFLIDNWFEGLKDKSDFSELNPRVVYEEEQREIERQRKIVEEKARQELEEKEERQKSERIETFQKLLVIEPEDPGKIRQLIKDGFNIEQDVHVTDLAWLFYHGRSLSFIEFLIEAGMKINEIDQQELDRQRKLAKERVKQKHEETERQKKFEEEKAKREVEDYQKRLEDERKAKQEEIERQLRKTEIEDRQKREELEKQKMNDEESARQKQREIERKRQVAEEIVKKQAEEHQKRLKAQRIEEFKKMCLYGYGEDINRLKELIDEGLNINEIEDSDCLESCISWKKSLPFIQLLVDSGVLVKNKHIEYCYTNKLYGIISILEKAKNIEDDAVKNIFKRIKNAVFGSISVACICIFSLFLPQILNREIDNFYYILVGTITFISLLMAIYFIADFRKKSKITDTIHLLGNQLHHRKQAGYEIPTAQDIIGIAGSLKEFNHKEINKKKMILWIVVTLISISLISLIYIYLEEVLSFLKVALILVVIIALFIWRYSPAKIR